MRSGPPAGCGWVSGYAGQRHYRADQIRRTYVQMASTGSANEAPGDYSKRMRDKKIMLAQYPGPDAKRFYSWTNGPLAKHLANKDAPDKMPDVVMDLSYALDHKPGEVVKLKYAEHDPLENKIADS